MPKGGSRHWLVFLVLWVRLLRVSPFQVHNFNLRAPSISRSHAPPSQPWTPRFAKPEPTAIPLRMMLASMECRLAAGLRCRWPGYNTQTLSSCLPVTPMCRSSSQLWCPLCSVDGYTAALRRSKSTGLRLRVRMSPQPDDGQIQPEQQFSIEEFHKRAAQLLKASDDELYNSLSVQVTRLPACSSENIFPRSDWILSTCSSCHLGMIYFWRLIFSGAVQESGGRMDSLAFARKWSIMFPSTDLDLFRLNQCTLLTVGLKLTDEGAATSNLRSMSARRSARQQAAIC